MRCVLPRKRVYAILDRKKSVVDSSELPLGQAEQAAFAATYCIIWDNYTESDLLANKNPTTSIAQKDPENIHPLSYTAAALRDVSDEKESSWISSCSVCMLVTR